MMYTPTLYVTNNTYTIFIQEKPVFKTLTFIIKIDFITENIALP